MLKVLWIAPIKYPNSSGHPAPWIEELAKNINTKISLTILNTSQHCKSKEDVFEFDNIKKVFLKTLRPKINILIFYFHHITVIRNWLKKNADEFDLIHIHGNEHQYEVAAKNIDIPKLLSVQGIISEVLKAVKVKGWKRLSWNIVQWYEKKHYKTINFYSCRTHWDKTIVKKYNGRAKIFEIWEVIRPDFFKQKIETPGKNILFLGGTQEIKGINYALKAFDKVRERIDGKLLIGGNVDIKKLKKIIISEELKIDIQRDIQLLGFLNPKQIISYAKTSFCFLHPTLIDNSPNSVCEAQVLGLPVIASDVGGVASLIDNNETGILVNLDCDIIADKIFTLHNDLEKWKWISNKSREVARKRHDPIQIVNDTLNMYNYIVAK